LPLQIQGESYYFILSACTDNDQAIKVFRDLAAKDTVKDSRSVYLPAVVACAYKGFSRMALFLVEEMMEKLVPVDRMVYHLAMRACSTGNDFKAVIRVCHVVTAPPFLLLLVSLILSFSCVDYCTCLDVT